MHVTADFPALRRITYLDSAASAWTPTQVSAAVQSYYRDYSCNIHRGIYAASERATRAYEEVRVKVARFIGALDPRCCIFTAGTTDGINMVAYTWGEQNIKEGDCILLSVMEHHSNLIPWQQLAARKGAELLWLEVTAEGRLDLEQLDALLARKPKLVALTWVSNVFGTINPIAKISEKAHQAGALVLVDAAQGTPHLPTSVAELGCDFLVFSGHKMLGPTGVGVLWAKRELLEEMPPFRFGGSMILQVKRDRVRWAEVPAKFEGGTPNIAGVIGLGAAIDYLEKLGMDKVRSHEQKLLAAALERLGNLEGMKLLGPCDPEEQSGVISFEYRGIHPHDMATILDRENICVRAGHHCCQPLMREFGMTGTTRASFYIYNNEADLDALEDGLDKAAEVFAGVL